MTATLRCNRCRAEVEPHGVLVHVPGCRWSPRDIEAVSGPDPSSGPHIVLPVAREDPAWPILYRGEWGRSAFVPFVGPYMVASEANRAALLRDLEPEKKAEPDDSPLFTSDTMKVRIRYGPPPPWDEKRDGPLTRKGCYREIGYGLTEPCPRNKRKCPCGGKLTWRGGGRRLMGCIVPRPHRHDPNKHRRVYRCDKGCLLVTEHKAKCPAEGCDFGAPETVRERRPWEHADDHDYPLKTKRPKGKFHDSYEEKCDQCDFKRTVYARRNGKAMVAVIP